MTASAPVVPARSEGPRASPARTFLLTALLLTAVVQGGFLLFVLGSETFENYLELNAFLAGTVLRAMGESVSVSGVTLSSPQGQVDVMRGCDGSQACALLAVCILSFPVAFRKRLAGAMCGIVVVVAMNLLRICSLFLLHTRASEAWFHLAHRALWPMTFMLVSVVLWVAWARWATEPGRRA